MHEEEIIKKLIEGDNGAFREVVESYQPMVYNTCMGFVHDAMIADDLSQDVFIEMYESISKFRGQSKLSTWLYRISVNKSLNYLRSQKKHSVLHRIDKFFSSKEEKPKERIPDEKTSTPIDIMEQEETSRAVHNAIDAMPENQRIAFVLHKFDDLSYKEIATIMDISLSAVESLIHRGKKNLQKSLLKTYQNLNS